MAEETTQLAEIEYLLKKLEASNLPPDLREVADVMIKRIRRMARQGQESAEYEPIAKFIDWCMQIPWGKYTKDNLDLDNARKVMDSKHYGGENVKQTIIEYLAVLKKKSTISEAKHQAPVLCFVGVQGTGKTTIAKAIAEALGRPFYRISLGALSSSSELRGKPKGNPDAEPGQIIKALAKTQSLSPVILLDEFDKVSGSQASLQDFMAILLEVLDPQQNTTFRDLYIDYPVDLSRVFFICTANTLKTVTRALLDRLEIVEFKDYTYEEKTIIAQRYLFPKVLEYAGLTAEEFQISDAAWPILVRKLGIDPGVRRLERNLQKLARRVTKQIVTGQSPQVTITPENLESFISEEVVGIEALHEKEFKGLEDKERKEEDMKAPPQAVKTPEVPEAENVKEAPMVQEASSQATPEPQQAIDTTPAQQSQNQPQVENNPTLASISPEHSSPQISPTPQPAPEPIPNPTPNQS